MHASMLAELLCVCINPVSCKTANKQNQLNEAADLDHDIKQSAVWPTSPTLLWYPERFRVSRHDLMHDSTELIQHLQALLLPHAGVIESRESRLEGRQEVSSQQHQAEQPGCCVVHFLPLLPR